MLSHLCELWEDVVELRLSTSTEQQHCEPICIERPPLGGVLSHLLVPG